MFRFFCYNLIIKSCERIKISHRFPIFLKNLNCNYFKLSNNNVFVIPIKKIKIAKANIKWKSMLAMSSTITIVLVAYILRKKR